MIRAVALEVGPHGIRINNVLPGAIATPMFDRLGSEEAAQAIAGYTPLRRIGQPADIGDVAVWLSTDEARFITGESLLVDGGFTIPGMRCFGLAGISSRSSPPGSVGTGNGRAAGRER